MIVLGLSSVMFYSNALRNGNSIWQYLTVMNVKLTKISNLSCYCKFTIYCTFPTFKILLAVSSILHNIPGYTKFRKYFLHF